MTITDEDLEHAAKKARIKAAKDKLYASKTVEKGLLMVHTGTGKGKSTAAWGLVMRTLGHGQRVGVVQFVKGRRETGERQFLERFSDLVTVKVMGEGFTWETQDKQRDIAAARAAWAEAKAMFADPAYHLVVLDELNIVLRYDYLEIREVLSDLARRPPMQHVVATGRNAKPELIEAADLVTVKSSARYGQAARRFLAVAVSAFAVSAAVLQALAMLTSWEAWAAILVSVFVIPAASYVINRLFVF